MICFEKVFKLWHGGVTDEAIVAAQLVKLNATLDVYEKILATQPYISGQVGAVRVSLARAGDADRGRDLRNGLE